MPLRILYMEDDAGTARLLQKRLQRLGYQVDIAPDGEAGLDAYCDGCYDALVIDQSMPGLDGLGVIQELAKTDNLLPTIMVTGAGDEAVAVEAMKAGANDYIVKDVNGVYLDLLPTVLEQALQQHQMAAEKRRADEVREQLIQELDAFAHTVAHDLKNPLSSIMLAASYLKLPDLPLEDIRQGMTVIEQTTAKMRSIIDELLLLSQVRQLDEITLEPLDMGHIALEAQERLAHMMQQFQGRIQFPDTWPVALGYAPWVEEIWVNFISNALKYGGRPPLVTLGANPPQDGFVAFWVQDNGNGLSSDEQQRLFTPFTRLSQVRAQGHGLGLSIVRRIVEKLGGMVGVESEVGAGSQFIFTLPIET